jgi:phage-related protein
MAYDYINFSCTLNSVYGTPGLYADLTACENAVNDGSVKLVLILNPLWSASKKASLPLLMNKLGDGYQQTVFQGVDQISEEWSITSPVLTGAEIDDLLNQLRTLCLTSFLWSPDNGVIEYQQFTCDEWQKIRIGVNTCQLATTFKSIYAAPGAYELYGNGIIRMTCDDTYTLFLNGVEVGSGGNWEIAQNFSVDFLYANQIAVVCYNTIAIAGLLGDISVFGTTVNTDSSWKYSTAAQTGTSWRNFNFDDSLWANATEIASASGWPKSIANIDGTTAKFIWSPTTSGNSTVYFRKKLIF